MVGGTPMARAKASIPTREEIIAASKVKLRPPKGVPKAVLAEIEREQNDYLVAWVQGLAGHMAKVDAAEKSKRKRAQGRKPAGPKQKSPRRKAVSVSKAK